MNSNTYRSLMYALLAVVISSQPIKAFAAELDIQFQKKAEIKLFTEGYKAVKLTPDIYANTKSNLADILIMSDSGEPVPYFIQNQASAYEHTDAIYPMTQNALLIKNNVRYYDYFVSSIPENQDIIATSIKIYAQGQFVKTVSIQGSYDGAYWENAVNYTIYNVDGSQRLDIPLSPALKYTWYRFGVPFADDPIHIDKVELYYSSAEWHLTSFTEHLSPLFSMEQAGRKSVITIKDVKNLPIINISLSSNSMFKRMVSVAHTKKTLFNLRFNDNTYQDLTIPLYEYASKEDSLKLNITNNDDLPIQVDSIDVEYRTAYLVFEAPKSKRAYVYYGCPAIETPPYYDITEYKDLVINHGYVIHALGDPEILNMEPSPEPSNSPDYSMYYNIVIGLTAAVLIVIIVIRLQKVHRNGD